MNSKYYEIEGLRVCTTLMDVVGMEEWGNDGKWRDDGEIEMTFDFRTKTVPYTIVISGSNEETISCEFIGELPEENQASFLRSLLPTAHVQKCVTVEEHLDESSVKGDENKIDENKIEEQVAFLRSLLPRPKPHYLQCAKCGQTLMMAETTHCQKCIDNFSDTSVLVGLIQTQYAVSTGISAVSREEHEEMDETSVCPVCGEAKSPEHKVCETCHKKTFCACGNRKGPDFETCFTCLQKRTATQTPHGSSVCKCGNAKDSKHPVCKKCNREKRFGYVMHVRK